MAGVSEAASILTIIQISTQVFSWCQDYILSVKYARKDAQRLSTETVALVDILQNIADLDRAKLPNVDLLNKPGGQLEQCKELLNQLATKLDPGDGKGPMKSLGLRALKWPFSSKEVEKYVRIIGEHKVSLSLAMNADQTTMTLDIDQGISQLSKDKIIKWLSFADTSINHIAAQEKHEPMTGNWLMKRSEFEHWKTAPNSLLWLHGKGVAGCGKTILCSTIINHTKAYCQQRTGFAAAFFYFDFNDAGKQSVRSLLSSLIAQLCCGRHDIPDVIKDLHRAYQNGHQNPTTDDLKAALLAILNEFEDIYLIIDALDECPVETGERERLLTVIREIHNWPDKRTHMLATSRREIDIEQAITPLLNKTPVCIDSALVDEDIRVYVSSQLEGPRFSNWPSRIKQEVESELTAQANGMFRWVVCQLDMLRNNSQPSKIRNALKSLPKTLDATYDRMLLSIAEDYQDQALTALKWLAFSARPLRITELAEAVVINPQENPPFDPEDRLFAPTDVLRFLPGLVTVSPFKDKGEDGDDKMGIRLAHFSIKEYLVSQRIYCGPASKYSIADVSANISIAEMCLTYLLKVCNSDSLSDHTLKEFPLLKYSARYWPQHMRIADQISSPALDQLSMELLWPRTMRFINWIRIYEPKWYYLTPVVGAQDIAPQLYYVSGMGLFRVVQLLLGRGADVNTQGGWNGSALQEASYRGHEKIVQLLLDRGALLSHQDMPPR